MCNSLADAIADGNKKSPFDTFLLLKRQTVALYIAATTTATASNIFLNLNIFFIS